MQSTVEQITQGLHIFNSDDILHTTDPCGISNADAIETIRNQMNDTPRLCVTLRWLCNVLLHERASCADSARSSPIYCLGRRHRTAQKKTVLVQTGWLQCPTVFGGSRAACGLRQCLASFRGSRAAFGLWSHAQAKTNAMHDAPECCSVGASFKREAPVVQGCFGSCHPTAFPTPFLGIASRAWCGISC